MKIHRPALKFVPALILALLLSTVPGMHKNEPNKKADGSVTPAVREDPGAVPSGTPEMEAEGPDTPGLKEGGQESPDPSALRPENAAVRRESLATKQNERFPDADEAETVPEAVPEKPKPKVKPDKLPNVPSSYRLPYLIRVNRQANCVTVYRGDGITPVSAFICSCGKNTPVGTFKITAKYTWGELFNDSWGQYSSRLGSYDLHILIHSAPYMQTRKGTLRTAEYDKLGTSASLGCVRMTVRDCKWVFDNCPNGTVVEIYDSPYPGPLGKPGFRRIGNAPRQYCFWDPTDPDYRNPWIQVKETIELLADHVTVKAGSTVDLDALVRAYDEFGTEVPYVIRGEVEPYEPGDYEIVYRLASGKDVKKLTVTVQK